MRVGVIGLGAMGIAATRVLAGRGHAVIGIDRHGVANGLGSSAHDSRIFRLSYPTPEYVALARRSLRLWRELERRDGVTLLRATGLLEIGGPHEATIAALRGQNAAVIELEGGEVGELFAGLMPRPGLPARFTPAAGVLAARDCLLVQAEIAARDGAAIHGDEHVIALEPRSGGVRIVTSRRAIDVDVAVVTAGPWANDLVASLGIDLPLTPRLAQTTVYDGPQAALAPCLIEWDATGDQLLYGLPVKGRGYKLGLGHAPAFDPADDERRVDHGLVLALSRIVADGFGGLDPQPLTSERCPWTNSPDGDFILDRHGHVVIGAGCSGHAFKFSPALGELLADLVEGGSPLPRFALDRPALTATANGR